MKKKHSIYNNDKGSTLINVIVTLGLLSILTSLVIIMTNNNILTKNVDRESKNNFYSAEDALNIIETGIQVDMSKCMLNSYKKVMSEYATNINYKDNVDAMLADYYKMVIDGVGGTDGFKATMKDTIENCVNKDYLLKYFDTDVVGNMAVLDSGASVSLNGTASVPQAGDPEYKAISYSVAPDNITFTMTGIELVYTKNGYEDILDTDLVITVPTPDFSIFETNSAKSSFNEFCMLAADSIDIVGSPKDVEVKGSVWAGNSIVAENAAEVEFKSNIIFAGGRDYNINNSTIDGSIKGRVASAGTISGKSGIILNSTGTFFDIMKYNAIPTIMASNYLVTGRLDIAHGNCYAFNDMLLNNESSKVNISGAYFGLGGDAKIPSLSSSIIVNKKNATLNMDLDNLTLKGAAFISALDYTPDPNNTVATGFGDAKTGIDICTGDSVAVRGNQVAYLVDASYTPFVSNPVTKADFAKYCGNDTKFSVASQKVIDEIDAKLDAEPISAYLDDVGVQAVYYRPMYGASGDEISDGVVYFYYVFKSVKSAGEYYATKYAMNTRSELVDLIPANISIKVPADKAYTAGSYIISSEKGNEKFGNPQVDSTLDQGLIRNYIKYYLSTTEPTDLSIFSYKADTDADVNNAIDNVLNIALINGLKSDAEDVDGQKVMMDASYKISGESKYRAVIAYDTYQVNDNYIGIVIAPGDITINNNFRGLAVSINGSVKINGNYTVTADSDVIISMLNYGNYFMTVNNTNSLGEFFNLNAKDNDTTESIVSMDNMFEYVNWRKNGN